MNPIFTKRLESRVSEMKALYDSLYHDDAAFGYFCKMLEKCFNNRKTSLHLLGMPPAGSDPPDSRLP